MIPSQQQDEQFIKDIGILEVLEDYGNRFMPDNIIPADDRWGHFFREVDRQLIYPEEFMNAIKDNFTTKHGSIQLQKLSHPQFYKMLYQDIQDYISKNYSYKFKAKIISNYRAFQQGTELEQKQKDFLINPNNPIQKKSVLKVIIELDGNKSQQEGFKQLLKAYEKGLFGNSLFSGLKGQLFPFYSAIGGNTNNNTRMYLTDKLNQFCLYLTDQNSVLNTVPDQIVSVEIQVPVYVQFYNCMQRISSFIQQNHNDSFDRYSPSQILKKIIDTKIIEEGSVIEKTTTGYLQAQYDILTQQLSNDKELSYIKKFLLNSLAYKFLIDLMINFYTRSGIDYVRIYNNNRIHYVCHQRYCDEAKSDLEKKGVSHQQNEVNRCVFCDNTPTDKYSEENLKDIHEKTKEVFSNIIKHQQDNTKEFYEVQRKYLDEEMETVSNGAHIDKSDIHTQKIDSTLNRISGYQDDIKTARFTYQMQMILVFIVLLQIVLYSFDIPQTNIKLLIFGTMFLVMTALQYYWFYNFKDLNLLILLVSILLLFSIGGDPTKFINRKYVRISAYLSVVVVIQMFKIYRFNNMYL